LAAASEFGPGELKNGIVEGRFLATEESGKALIDEGYATITGLQAGDNLRISGRDFQIVGVVATPSASVLGATNVYMPLKEAQEIAASASQIGDFQKDDVNLIFVKVDAARLSIVQDEINTLLPGLTVSSPQSFLALMGGIASAVKRLALVGTLIALLAAVGITVRTTVSNVWERRCDIAVMKAVGWTSADVRRQVMGENLLIGLAGGALGVVIFFIFTLALRKQAVNIPLPWELNPYPHFYLSDAAKFLEIPLHVTLAWNVVLLSLFLGVALAIFTVVVASWYLAKIKPAEVFRYE
jgi:putative ABC transport system permease protein